MTLNYRVVPPEENQEYLQGWPQVEVFEGSYSPDILAPMLEFTINEILSMVYLRARNAIGGLKSYICETEDLSLQGQEPASLPNTLVDKAHNVKLPAIPISACFRPWSKEWVSCDPGITLKSGHQGVMAGPRYHRYVRPDLRLETTQGAINLRGNNYSIIVEGQSQEIGTYHRLLLTQEHAEESLKNAQAAPQSAFWTGHHWHLDKHHRVYLTIINFEFDFTLAPIPHSRPQFVPVARNSVRF